MREIEYCFKDKQSENIHQKLLEKNGATYSDYFNELIDIPFDFGRNNIPENTTFSLDCIQLVEIYNRNSKERIKRLFHSILRSSEGDKNKNKSNKEEIEKCIIKLSEGDFSFFTTWFSDFKIKCKSKYIDCITLSLTAVGPSLFRIIFNCYPNDLARYNYWQCATPNVKREIGLKRNILRSKLKIERVSSMQRKNNALYKLEKEIYKNAYSIIKRIAPGIFYNTLNEFPSTLLSSYEKIDYTYIILSNKYYSKQESTNFYNNIIDCDASHSRRYVDQKYGNIFIPPSENGNKICSIFMKHIRTGMYISPTQQISWLAIIYSLLKSQYKCIQSIRNNYYDIDINNRKMRMSKNKKIINRSEAIWALLKSSYDREKKDYIDRFDKTIDYIYSFKEYSISYYQEYIEKIDFLAKDIELKMNELKELYHDRYEDQSSKTNLNLQVFALILALFTIGQTIYQCSMSNEKKQENDEPKQFQITPNNCFNLTRLCHDSYLSSLRSSARIAP